MSNTSRVTPYESSDSNTLETGIGIAAACIGAVAAGTIALARWLAEEAPEDREAVDRLKAEQRRERLEQNATWSSRKIQSVPVRLTTMGLHLQDPGSLVRSAEKIGYRVIDQPAPLRKQTRILLTRASGERLAIERNAKGRLVVHTAREQNRIQALVRQHTVDQTIEHLRSRGMDIQTATLSNGEVQILASERANQRYGTAQVRTQIHADGNMWIDIDRVRGNRCEEIVAELVQAVGGQVLGMQKKDSYFQSPGEPAKIEVKL